MQEICPKGTVFTPREKKISRNPSENVVLDNLAAVARVLLDTLIELMNT